MPEEMTLGSLQAELTDLKNRKLVLTHLIEHVDSNFRSTGPGTTAKNLLLTPEKTPVPEEAFERVTVSLVEQIAVIDARVSAILSTPLTIVRAEPPAPPPAPPPEPSAPPPVQPPVVAAPTRRGGRAKQGARRERGTDAAASGTAAGPGPGTVS